MVELNKNLKFDPKEFVKTLPPNPGEKNALARIFPKTSRVHV